MDEVCLGAIGLRVMRPPITIVYLRPRRWVLLMKPAMTGPGILQAFVIA